VQRRGQRGRFHHRGAAAGFDESHLVVPADLVGDADALVELDQVGAGAKENVLAVVDDLAGAGMLVGRSASAEEGTLFEEVTRKPASARAQAAASPARPPPAMATVGWDAVVVIWLRSSIVEEMDAVDIPTLVAKSHD
jgi:hypothetical protein